MVERISWEEWKKRRSELMRRFFESEPRRLPRRRPPDPEKRLIMAELMRAHKRRWIESGKLVELGPRRWLFRVSFHSSMGGL